MKICSIYVNRPTKVETFVKVDGVFYEEIGMILDSEYVIRMHYKFAYFAIDEVKSFDKFIEVDPETLDESLKQIVKQIRDSVSLRIFAHMHRRYHPYYNPVPDFEVSDELIKHTWKWKQKS